ncbi:MAG: ribokinase [Gammaproteobacteria bacterium]|nr:ribokinase [Gammaproteobacteria bacterium]NNF49791.1 ribokinase [Woeseiaceae bacterium]MBT8094055.1 ribokinase [Gammaproteobacteria bacterium]MBT8105714.1 ribokinase [Gammaproteobacteria bacterium]NNK25728.1 ribokinase [Woeseiaceae bacterium]
MARIAVIGSVNLDIVAQAPKLPAPGETVTGAELHHFPGGKGANQALAARRLGADVSLYACVGDDATADEALALLRAGDVNLEHCGVVSGVTTGTALIAVAPDGENHIVVAPGANRELTAERIPALHADAVICQLEVPVDTIARVAQTFEGLFCVNLAPARHIDVSILQRADLVVVNETEADWYGGSLAACHGMVATTRGAGRATLERDGELLAEAQPPAVDAVDATGAGDTFTAALVVALAEGQPPRRALEFACAAGAAATLKMGAQPSLPMRDDLELD